jgi:hypothetical protein
LPLLTALYTIQCGESAIGNWGFESVHTDEGVLGLRKRGVQAFFITVGGNVLMNSCFLPRPLLDLLLK